MPKSEIEVAEDRLKAAFARRTEVQNPVQAAYHQVAVDYAKKLLSAARCPPGAESLSDYEALKAYGFSPAKAAEIELDVKRGDVLAKQTLLMVREAQSKS